MSEKYADVTVSGKTFRIKKFDALTGSFMLIKITGLLAPLFKGLDIKKLQAVNDPSEVEIGSLDVMGFINELTKLSEDDFRYVQINALKLCSQHLPAGFMPVINENGSFGVQDLDDDTMTVLALTAHALMFNVKGFFLGGPLGSFVGGLLNTSPRS